MPKVEKDESAPRTTNDSSRKSVIDRIGTGWMAKDSPIQLAIYGKSGTGKTTFWSTFPGPIFAILCAGARSKPGELLSVDTPELRKKIQPVVLEQADELRQLTDFLARKGKEFGTIVLDHMSGYQDLVMKEVLGLAEIPEQKTWGMATKEDWGQIIVRTKMMVGNILNLTKQNIVIVAQERNFSADDDEDPEVKKRNRDDIILPWVGAALAPNLTNWLNHSVDYVCHTRIGPKIESIEVDVPDEKGNGTHKEVQEQPVSDEVQWYLRTAPSDIFMTKFRLPRGTRSIPKYIADPSYTKLISVIRGPSVTSK